MAQTVRIVMLGSGFVAGFYIPGLANVNHQEMVVSYSPAHSRRWVRVGY